MILLSPAHHPKLSSGLRAAAQVGEQLRACNASSISTGGTIATSSGPDGVARPTRSGADLTSGLDVDVVELMAASTARRSTGGMDRIGTAVAASQAAGGAAGIVLTHGTDTMEETALWLAAHLRRAVPAVVRSPGPARSGRRRCGRPGQSARRARGGR